MTEGPGDETQALPVTPAHDTDSVQRPGWVLAARYRVLDRLGVGGMAEVFRAHDEQLDRDVAVKVFRTPVDEPGNAQAPERRETELRALAQLSHPNLITLYDANLAGPDPAFLVTELVIGPNLADRLAEGPLPEDLVRTIGIQVADALAYVHTSGMVHRDIKPANILLGTDGPDPETATIRARLSDFGIVRVIDGARMTAAEFTLGTASYIAPEQARGADVGTAADVYALGLVLIEMLTGVRSFDGPFHEAVAARLVRAPEIPAGLPMPWPGLLAAMTAFDPALRPSAAEVADALRTSAPPALPPPIVVGPDDDTVFTAPVAGPLAAAPLLAPQDAPPEEPRRGHRGAALAAAALAFVAVIATALVLLLKPSSHSPTAPQGGTNAPTTTAAQSGSNGSGKSGRPGVPITAGGSGASSGASASGASSGAPSSGASPTGASSTHSASHSATHFSTPPAQSTSARPSRSSTSARPSSSAPRSSTPRTTTAPPSSSPATSSSAAAGTGGPTSGSVAALPSGGP